MGKAIADYFCFFCYCVICCCENFCNILKRFYSWFFTSNFPILATNNDGIQHDRQPTHSNYFWSFFFYKDFSKKSGERWRFFFSSFSPEFFSVWLEVIFFWRSEVVQGLWAIFVLLLWVVKHVQMNFMPKNDYLFISCHKIFLWAQDYMSQQNIVRSKKKKLSAFLFCLALITQPMLQCRPNQTELRSMDSNTQILCRFQKSKQKKILHRHYHVLQKK